MLLTWKVRQRLSLTYIRSPKSQYTERGNDVVCYFVDFMLIFSYYTSVQASISDTVVSIVCLCISVWLCAGNEVATVASQKSEKSRESAIEILHSLNMLPPPCSRLLPVSHPIEVHEGDSDKRKRNTLHKSP